MMNSVKRRQFLQSSLGLAAGLIALKVPQAGAQALSCAPTAKQTKGPFYPGEQNMVAINDLTRVDGASESAKGQVIYVHGRVQDSLCRPVRGANVEIWQACASGRYNHDQDPNAAPLDPNFRYWGETFTNAQGEYFFKTILPGAYPADVAWDRPPHIHFRIAKLGFKELVTQMYFKGQQLNDLDLILAQVPENNREAVIVDFKPDAQDPFVLSGRFDITIEKIGS